jgi:hypothetical protein
MSFPRIRGLLCLSLMVGAVPRMATVMAATTEPSFARSSMDAGPLAIRISAATPWYPGGASSGTTLPSKSASAIWSP